MGARRRPTASHQDDNGHKALFFKKKKIPNKNPNLVSYTMSTVLKTRKRAWPGDGFLAFQDLFVTPNSQARAQYSKLTKWQREESKSIEKNEARMKIYLPGWTM